jgi:predicted dehydrogenase
MPQIKRREFLKRSKHAGLGLAAGITILSDPKSARGTPANEKIVLAAVGCGGRSSALTQGFLERGDCEFAYACDPNTPRAEARARTIAQAQDKAPRILKDFREMLEDESVDAIVSATPDHWHALTTVWACQAGKDVYVEKPPTHNCWEGQQMLKAARKYKRIVQCGYQNRSAPYLMAAKKYIEDGKLGSIHLCRIFNQKPPWGMSPVVSDGDPPAGLDWNIWNGPAPEHPYNASMHSSWHHLWRYSGGDIANDASHQIDIARWLLGVEHPKSVYSTGGRFATDPETLVAETPDTQMALYDFDKLLVSFELTLYTSYMLKTCPQVRNEDLFPLWPQNSTRIELYGTESMMIIGRMGGGWQVFVRTKDRKPVVKDQMFGRFPDPEHQENFVQCIRSRKLPNADIAQGHMSCLLIHYGNMSYRLGGQKLTVDSTTDQIVGNEDAMKLFKRQYREPWVIEEDV